MEDMKLILLLLIFGITLYYFKPFGSGVEISTNELLGITQKEKNPVIIDVRTKGEYNGPLGHINNSILIPLSEIDERYSELDSFKDKPIYVVCKSGGRSSSAAKKLASHGFNAINVKGGMMAWNKIKKY
jgi:rhodanese-related sulfurtransferase